VANGFGEDGTPFSTVHLGLFLDHFVARPGKYFGGVYISYLSAASHLRSDSQAARIISATQPGVSSEIVLMSILQHLKACQDGIRVVAVRNTHRYHVNSIALLSS
jgi:hypothetical protein